MKQFYFITIAIVFLLFSQNSWGQIKLGNNPETIDPAALLELESSTKGLLLPRMTSAQRDALPMQTSPVGLLIYNTDINEIQYLFEATVINAKGEKRQELRWESATDDTIPFSRPTDPQPGQFFYEVAMGQLNIWDGDKWVIVGGSTSNGNSGGSTTTLSYQSLTLVGNQLSITNGNSVDLSGLVTATVGPIGPQGPAGATGPPGVSSNQNLSVSALSSNNTLTLAISGGNTETLDLSSLASVGTGLVSVKEGKNTGHRLATEKATNHGDIGLGAIDLSIQTSTSTSTGARGDYSFASGNGTTALGRYSTAGGLDAIASGSFSFVRGYNNIASGSYASAWGESTTASTSHSTAWGFNTIASGIISTAWGANATASGSRSTAWGENATASGNYSTAWGEDTTAESYGQTSLGIFSTPVSGSTTSVLATDRLLVIGNGTGTSNRSDALVILKNGNSTLNGALTINNPTSTSSYTLPTAKGAAGQILSIDNATTGTTTWTTVTAGTAATGLVSVTENGKAGYRLALEPAANHGDIGTGAIDLSIQTSTSTTTGARGDYSFASGNGTTASGYTAAAMGQNTTASGRYSRAWGRDAIATGEYSTVWGLSATTSANWSTAWGSSTVASAELATAWGEDTTASGNYSTVWGRNTTAESYGQTTLGLFNTAVAGNPGQSISTDRLLVVGNGTSTVSRTDALVILKNGNTILNGALTINATSTTNSYTLPTGGGTNGQVLSMQDATTGTTTWTTVTAGTAATGLVSVTENGNAGHRLATSVAANHGDIGTAAIDLSYQSAVATVTGARGNYSFVWGNDTTASGQYSTAGGLSTIASAQYSTAWGRNTTASDEYSTAWGSRTTASGEYSTAWGERTTASGNYSTAWGDSTTASGEYSTAWGERTTASGFYATVWGEQAMALGRNASAWGDETNASGRNATAWGKNTTAETYGQTTLGVYNTAVAGNAGAIAATDRLLVVGNGTGTSNRSDALVILKNGNTTFGGSISQTGTSTLHPDYVFEEYFEGESKHNPRYTLPSLTEVETFVKANKHLPGVQSRADITKKGKWNVTENVRTNLEKVEELYLYTIEQQKEIEAKNIEIDRLNKRLQKIEALLGIEK